MKRYDRVVLCPHCDGSGEGVADTKCAMCGGQGGLTIEQAEHLHVIVTAR